MQRSIEILRWIVASLNEALSCGKNIGGIYVSLNDFASLQINVTRFGTILGSLCKMIKIIFWPFLRGWQIFMLQGKLLL